LDHRGRARPLEITVAVVPVELRAHGRPRHAVVPLARDALLGPLAHAGHVGDGVVDRLGGGGDVTGDLDAFGHGCRPAHPGTGHEVTVWALMASAAMAPASAAGTPRPCRGRAITAMR